MNYDEALGELDKLIQDYLEKAELTNEEKIDILGDLMETCRELRRELILNVESYEED